MPTGSVIIHRICKYFVKRRSDVHFQSLPTVCIMRRKTTRTQPHSFSFRAAPRLEKIVRPQTRDKDPPPPLKIVLHALQNPQTAQNRAESCNTDVMRCNTCNAQNQCRIFRHWFCFIYSNTSNNEKVFRNCLCKLNILLPHLPSQRCVDPAFFAFIFLQKLFRMAEKSLESCNFRIYRNSSSETVDKKVFRTALSGNMNTAPAFSVPGIYKMRKWHMVSLNEYCSHF